MSARVMHYARLYSGTRTACGIYLAPSRQVVRGVAARATLAGQARAEHLAQLALVTCASCLRSSSYRAELLLAELADTAEARQDRGECPACGDPADLPGTETECPCHAWPVPATTTTTTTEASA